MSHQTAIRILVVDDHSIFRGGVKSIIGLERDMEVIAEASTGVEAITLYEAHRPDVTLMDLRLPDISGAEAIIRIRDLDPHAKVIALTVCDGDEHAYRALLARCRGYLVKHTPDKELLSVIRAVHQGRHCIPKSLSDLLAERLTLERLTSREVEIVELVADGLSNQEIAKELSIAPGTVKNHIGNIIQKLEARDRTHAVTLAHERRLIDLDALARRRRDLS